VGARGTRARLLEDQLFSKSREDREHALYEMLRTGATDPEAIAIRYHDLAEGDPRRERVAEAYVSLAGHSIEQALVRLGLAERSAAGAPAPEQVPATRTPGAASTAIEPR